MHRMTGFIRLSLSMVIVSLCCSWGFLVHRTLAQLAVYQLPKKMRPFFYKNMNYLVKQSVRPDLRRNTDSTENAKHFIDLEMYGDSAAWKMPMHWDDAVKTYARDTLLKYGYVPYVVIMVKDRLIHALKNGDKDSILFYAADLSHYIGDAHVPLHTSANYDGQFTKQKGIHALWETMIPEIEFDKYKFYGHHEATYLSNPEQAIWEGVRSAHNLLAELFQQESELTRTFTDSPKYRVQVRKGKEYTSYTSAFAKAYSDRLGNTINIQLIRSANLIANFWYTCWVDAGKPDLDHLLSTPFVRKDRKVLRHEYKDYKKGRLLEKNLLIARHAEATAE